MSPLSAGIRAAFLPAGLILSLHSGVAMAGPEGGKVVGGQGNINKPDANTTVINQKSQNLAVDWTSFNVKQKELVRFKQPAKTANALNRIYDQNPSQIYGTIRANGNVTLLNPNGVFFSPTARVNVNNLKAGTLVPDPDRNYGQSFDMDFFNGAQTYKNVDGSEGIVVNQGLLEAATGGSVTLMGQAVKNEGVILAYAGQVNLVAGEQVTMDFDGDGLIQFSVDKEVLKNSQALDSQVSNTGEINADGGAVLLAGSSASEVFSQVVNNEGVISAQRIENKGGTVRLVGGGSGSSVLNMGTVNASAGDATSDGGNINIAAENIENSGELRADSTGGNGGTIHVESKDTTLVTGNAVISASSIPSPLTGEGQDGGGKGGTVQILGDKVGLLDNSTVNVSGVTGGGEALIGGDFQGKNPDVKNASKTYVGSNVAINADATESGDGGKVIVWADEVTAYYGDISARGGEENGDGGFVEVSGKTFLDFNGDVDTTAPNGKTGTLLLDPRDILIDGSTTDDAKLPDILFADDNGGGATNDDFSISAAAINTSSDTNNIILQANRDIIQSAGEVITFTSSNSLVMQAGENITLNDDVTTAGGDIHLEANSPSANDGAATTGILTIAATKTVTSGGGNITLIAEDFTLDGSVAAGSGDISLTAIGDSSGPTGEAAFEIGSAADLTDAELGRFSSTGTVTIGEATTASAAGVIGGGTTIRVGAIEFQATSNVNTAGGVAGSLVFTADDGITFNDDAAFGQTVTFNADGDADNAGAITRGAAEVITGSTVNLNAATGITIDTAATTISSVNTTSGNIDINNAATAATTLSNFDHQGTGNILFDQTGNQSLALTSVTTNDGDITITNTGGVDSDVTVKTVTADTTDDTVSITAEDGIIDDAADTATDIITAANISLTSSANASGIGQGAEGAIQVNATVSFAADSSTGGGNITVEDTTGDFPLGLVDAGTGTVDLTSAGSITDANAGTNNIAAGTADLTATGAIGDLAGGGNGDVSQAPTDSLETTVSTLSVDAVEAAIANTIAGGLTVTSVTPAGVAGSVLITNNTDLDITAHTLSNDGDSIGYVSTAGSVTVPDAAIDVGAGTIRIEAATNGQDVVDATDSDLSNNLWTADTVVFASGTGESLNLSVANLTANITDTTGGGAGDLTVAEANGISLTNIDTADGMITVTATLGNIEVLDVDAAGTNTVTLDSTAGNINDGGAVSEVITADSLRLSAETGILALDTAVSNLAAETDTTGNLEVFNTGALDITTVDGVVGVQIVDAGANDGGGDIVITASSPLTVSDDVINNDGGDITLAAEGNAATDDLTIDANVTATGGTGSINLFAGDSILHNSGTISAVSTGAILLSAGEDFNGGANQNGNAGGAITMTDGLTISSEDGNITLRAPESIAVSILNADSDSAGATGNVTVTADFDGVGGGLADNAGAVTDNLTGEAANIIGNTITLQGPDGIGNGDDIDVTVATELNADSSGNNGNIELESTGDMPIGVINAGSGNVTLISTGAMTDTNGGTLNITGNLLDMTANGGAIGTSGDKIDTNVTQIVADTTAVDGSGVFINELDVAADGLAIGAADILTDGGDVEIMSAGDVTSASGADIETTAAANSGVLSVSGDVTITGTGTATVNLGGAITTTGADDDGTNAAADNGGLVTISTNNGTIQTAAITTSGGAGTAGAANGGDAGAVSITAGSNQDVTVNGNITTAGGTSAGGTPGNGGTIDVILGSAVYTQNDFDLNSGNSDITITADTLTIVDNTGDNAFQSTSTITLQPFTDGTTMSIGGTTGGFNLTQAEVLDVAGGAAGTIIIGKTASTGLFTFDNTTDFGTNDVQLIAGSFVDTAGQDEITAGSLDLNARTGSIGILGSPIETDVTLMDASVATAGVGNGGIFIGNENASVLFLGNARPITTGSDDSDINISSAGSLTVNNSMRATGTGSITLTAGGHQSQGGFTDVGIYVNIANAADTSIDSGTNQDITTDNGNINLNASKQGADKGKIFLEDAVGPILARLVTGGAITAGGNTETDSTNSRAAFEAVNDPTDAPQQIFAAFGFVISTIKAAIGDDAISQFNTITGFNTGDADVSTITDSQLNVADSISIDATAATTLVLFDLLNPFVGAGTGTATDFSLTSGSGIDGAGQATSFENNDTGFILTLDAVGNIGTNVFAGGTPGPNPIVINVPAVEITNAAEVDITDVSTSDTVFITPNALTGNVNITKTGSGDILLQQLDATGFSITLDAQEGSILEDVDDATADIIGTDLILNADADGSTGVAQSIGSNAARLEINATNSLTAAANGAGVGNDIFIEDTAGGLAITETGVNAEDGTLDILVTGGNLTSTDGGDEDLEAATINIEVTGAGTVGTNNTTGRLEVGADQLNVLSAGGDIFLEHFGGDVEINRDNLAGAGGINAGAGNVDLLVTAGGITSGGTDDTDVDITGNSVTLDVSSSLSGSGAGVGTTTIALDISASTLSAIADDDNINIDSFAPGAVTVTNLQTTAGTGFIQLDQTGDESLQVDSAISNNGTITLTNTGDAAADTLTATTITTGTNNNVSLTTNTRGNIVLDGTVNVGTGMVTINSVDGVLLNNVTADDLTANVDADGTSGGSLLDLGDGTLTVTNTIQLSGTGTDDTLRAQPSGGGGNTWIVSAANTGTLNGAFASFSNIGTISGDNSPDPDTIDQSAAGAAAGAIDVVLSSVGTDDGMAGTITGLIDFDNIDSIDNDDDADNSITGANAIATWTIDGGLTENYAIGGQDLDFTNNFTSLTGGGGADTYNISANYTADLIGDPAPAGDGADSFVFTGTATLTGSIDGGPFDGAGGGTATANDTIDFSGSTLGQVVTTNTGTDNGQQGTIQDDPGVSTPPDTDLISGTYDNINTITGNGLGTLIGPNTETWWNITTIDQGTFGDSFANIADNSFNNFAIQAGSAKDVFLFEHEPGGAPNPEEGQITGGIDGGAGENVLVGSVDGDVFDITGGTSVTITVGGNDGSGTDLQTTLTSISKIDASAEGNVSEGADDNIFNIDNTWNGDLIGGDGDDDFNLASGVSFGSLAGGLGSDDFNITDGTNTYVINGVGAGADGSGGTFNGDGILELEIINAGTGVDTFNIQAVDNALTINAGTGNDIFNVSSNAPTNSGTLDNIVALLTLRGDADSGAGDTLNISDSGDADADNGQIDTTDITGIYGGGGSINYSDGGTNFIENITITLGSGDDTFNVAALNADAGSGSNVTVNGSGGDDTVDLGSSSLDGILGTLTVNGNGHTTGDTLNINDDTDNDGNTYTITDTTIARTGIPTITYGTFEQLDVNTGGGNDTINASGWASTTGNITDASGTDADNFNVTGSFSVTGDFSITDIETLSDGTAGTGGNSLGATLLDIDGADGAGTPIDLTTAITTLEITNSGAAFIEEATGIDLLDINTGAGNFTLTTANGSITNNTGAAVDITTTGDVFLTANGAGSAIGAADPNKINLNNVNQVTAEATNGAGGIFLNQTTGAMNVVSVDAGTGEIQLMSASSITAGPVDGGNLTTTSTTSTTFNMAVNVADADITTGTTLDINNTFNASGIMTVDNTGLFTKNATGTVTANGGFSATGNANLANNITTVNNDLTIAGTLTIAEATALTLSTGAGGGLIGITGEINGTTGGVAETLTLDSGNGNIGDAPGTGPMGDIFGAGGAVDATGLTTVNITSSNVATFGEVGISGDFSLADIDTSVTFQNVVNLGSLSPGGGSYAVSLLSGTNGTSTIGGATTFSNSGLVTLGDEAGDTINFNTGGLTHTAGTTNLAGTINTTDTAVNLAAVNLDADTSVISGPGDTAASSITLGNIDSDGFALTLDSGSAASTSITSFTDDGNFTIEDALSFNASGAINADDAVFNNSTNQIQLNSTANTFNTLTVNAGVNDFFLNGSTVADTGTTTFDNADILLIGFGSGSVNTFNGDVVITAPPTQLFRGTINTNGGDFTADGSGSSAFQTNSTINAGDDATVNLGDFDAFGNNLTVTADEINFTGGANTMSGFGTLTLNQFDANLIVGGADNADVANLNISTTDLAAIQNGANNIILGDGSGTTSMSGAINVGGSSLRINGNTANFSANTTFTASQTNINATINDNSADNVTFNGNAVINGTTNTFGPPDDGWDVANLRFNNNLVVNGTNLIQSTTNSTFFQGSVTGSGTLAIYPTTGTALTIAGTSGTAQLRAPAFTNFAGHLVIGGSYGPLSQPFENATSLDIRASSITINNPLSTNGDITLLAGDLNINDNISAGGSGGDTISLVAAGNDPTVAFGGGNGDINVDSGGVTIAAGDGFIIAGNSINEPQDITLAFGGGNVDVAQGTSDENVEFAGGSNITATQGGTTAFNNLLGLFSFNLTVSNVTIQQAAAELLGIEELGFIDTGLFEEDLTLFGQIGTGIALALAQCEEIEGCAPNVTQEELAELIAQLEARIAELEKRCEDGDTAACGLLERYQTELEQFLAFQVELEEYFAVGEEEELPEDEFEAPDTADSINTLARMLETVQARIEFLESLKTDPEERARLSEITGIDLTQEVLDAIIEGAKSEAQFIEEQIRLLQEGTEANAGSIFTAEAGTFDRIRTITYGPSILNLQSDTSMYSEERFF